MKKSNFTIILLLIILCKIGYSEIIDLNNTEETSFDKYWGFSFGIGPKAGKVELNYCTMLPESRIRFVGGIGFYDAQNINTDKRDVSGFAISLGGETNFNLAIEPFLGLIGVIGISTNSKTTDDDGTDTPDYIFGINPEIGIRISVNSAIMLKMFGQYLLISNSQFGSNRNGTMFGMSCVYNIKN
jgi:hypothetical protein